MATRPSLAHIASELRLSGWLFGIFAVICGGLSAFAYFMANRVEGGWLVATCVALLAWALVRHFAKQLSLAASGGADGTANL